MERRKDAGIRNYPNVGMGCGKRIETEKGPELGL